MLRTSYSMRSDRESGLEPVCEVPEEHRHSRGGRLSLLTQRVARTCLDDCQLIHSGQQTFQSRLPGLIEFIFRVLRQ